MLSTSKLILNKVLVRNLKFSPSMGFKRAYHSYPDPNEKPVVFQSKSEAVKQILSKSSSQFTLDKKHSLDSIFPGTPLSKGISNSAPPHTISTILPNGLTVATQEMPGLMSSFAFLVRTGRLLHQH